MYFGVNLILMFDYGLSFDVEVKDSGSDDDKIEVLIISRKDIPAWKSSSNVNTTHNNVKLHYSNSSHKHSQNSLLFMSSLN